MASRVEHLFLWIRLKDQLVKINISLKRKRKQIAIADLFIAATAISHDLSFATFNKKHFDRIDGLNIVE